MKTKQQILDDMENAPKRLIPFYHGLTLILEEYDDTKLKEFADNEKRNINLLLKQRKAIKEKQFFKEELAEIKATLKIKRKQLKWIKYLID